MRFDPAVAGSGRSVLSGSAAARRGRNVRPNRCRWTTSSRSLNAAPGCDRAMKLFEACAYGASGDVQFGEAVEKKCEADFLGRLKAPQKQAYQREMRVCDRKYRNKSGTMYHLVHGLLPGGGRPALLADVR